MERRSQIPLEGFSDKRRRLTKARRTLKTFKRPPVDIRSYRLSEWSQTLFSPSYAKNYEVWKHSRSALMLEEASQNVEAIAPEMSVLSRDGEFEEIFDAARAAGLTTGDVVREVARQTRALRYKVSDELGLTKQYEQHVMSIVPNALNVSTRHVTRLYKEEVSRHARKLAPKRR